MPQLRIDVNSLYQLLRSPGFFDCLPASLEPLRQPAAEAVVKLQRWALNGEYDCSGCSPLKKELTPLLNELGRGLAVARQHDLTALQPLAEFIFAKRRSPPVPVVLLYVDEDNRTAELRIA